MPAFSRPSLFDSQIYRSRQAASSACPSKRGVLTLEVHPGIATSDARPLKGELEASA